MARDTIAITLDPGEPVLSDDCATCRFSTYLIPYNQVTSMGVRCVMTVRFCPHCGTVDEP